jgi:hypothetical protein
MSTFDLPASLSASRFQGAGRQAGWQAEPKVFTVICATHLSCALGSRDLTAAAAVNPLVRVGREILLEALSFASFIWDSGDRCWCGRFLRTLLSPALRYGVRSSCFSACGKPSFEVSVGDRIELEVLSF